MIIKDIPRRVRPIIITIILPISSIFLPNLSTLTIPGKGRLKVAMRTQG